MIPEGRLSSEPVAGTLLNPRTWREDVSIHVGPIALQDPSQGLMARVWRAEAQGFDVVLSATGVPAAVWYTHGMRLREVSLAFDQNGFPVVAFVAADGAFLRWYDPVAVSMVTTALASGTITPRVTTDDPRAFNTPQSDVILAYVRAGLLRYRVQRDRYLVEYTPTQGEGGPTVATTALDHVSLNDQLRLEFLTRGAGQGDWTLPQVIEELAMRAGLPPEHLSLALLPRHMVRGFTVTAANPCYGNIAALSQVFHFDPCNANGKVRFVPRGRNAVSTITEGEMIDTGEGVEDTTTRRDTIGIPRVLHLNYYDVAGGLNTDKQHSERPEGTRAIGEQSIQTAVVLSADEAATIVAKAHGAMAEGQKGELKFSLPDNWIHLTESDPVFVQYEGRTVRAMIVEVMTDDGEQAYRLVRDRQSLYTMQVEGIPAAPITRPPSGVVGPTLIKFLDIGPLRDAHDVLGYYVAVSGIYPAWQGATVELSLDGGANYIESATTRVDAVMGSLTTALGDHPQAFPDVANTCCRRRHAQRAAGGVHAGRDAHRANLAVIGDEVIAFADVDEGSEGVWDIKHMLRGRKGTDPAAHAIGERFVLLDGVAFIPADLPLLGETLTFRATSFGTLPEDGTVLTVAFTGGTQRERQPAYLHVRRDGADLVASCKGWGDWAAGRASRWAPTSMATASPSPTAPPDRCTTPLRRR